MNAGAIQMDVVFDVRTADFASWFAFVPLVVLLAALFVELVRRRREIRELFVARKNPHMAIYLLAGVVLAFLTGARILSYAEEKNEFVRVLNADQARVVEGEITNYTPQAWTGRPLEKFQVGSEQFSFDGFGASSAYHQRVRSGGPIQEGMRVRVFEFRGNILRVEVFPIGTRATPE